MKQDWKLRERIEKKRKIDGMFWIWTKMEFAEDKL